MTLVLSLSVGFDLTRSGAPVSLKNKKAQALLVYLALTGKPQSREHLATLLWGDRFDDQARSSLRQTLFVLRKAMGEDILVGDDPLTIADGALTLTPGLDPLRGFQTGADGFDAWLAQERARFRDRAAVDRAESAREAETAGDMSAAISLWGEALALDPVNEAFQRGLMASLSADGRRADALASYTRFADRLKVELDTKPSRATSDLADKIRAGNAPAKPAPAQTPPSDPPTMAHALIAPFADLGGGELASFFASEMSTEVSFRTRAINLVSILPAEPLSAPAEDPTRLLDAARERGAISIISGSARQIGHKIRVAASLMSVKENAVVWNDTLIVEEAEAFEAIGQFATTITQSLARFAGGIRSMHEQMARLEQRLDDPAAFHNDLQNLVWYGFFSQHSRSSQTDFSKTLSMAVDRFPDSPDCLAWYAYTLFHHGHLQDVPDRVDWYQKASDVIDRALAIDPGHGLALGGRIFTGSWLGNFKAVDAANDALVAMDSPFHVRSGIYAGSLIFRGRLEESLPYLSRAIELERGTPLLFYRYAFLGLGNFMSGDYAASLVAADNALTVGTEFYLSHLVRIAALERLDRHGEAVDAISTMRKDFVDPRLSQYGFLPITDQTIKAEFFGALRDAGLPD